MKMYSAKILFVFSIALISMSSVLQAQGFAGGVSIKGLAPVLSRVEGNLQDSWTGMSQSIGIDALGEYRFSNGALVNTELGWQQERTYLHTTSANGLANTGTGKRFQSIILSGGTGYIQRVGESNFYGVMSAGIGIGFKDTPDMSGAKERLLTFQWYDWSTGASGEDTSLSYLSVVDHELLKVDMQFRLSLGAEYRKENLFFRAFVEARHWMHKVAEVEYTAESKYISHDDYMFSPSWHHATGRYIIKAGYLGIGISAGWYFTKNE